MSNKTPPLPKEACNQLAKEMDARYSLARNGRTFAISSFEQDEYCYLTVTLANEDKSFVYPVESRIQYKKEGLGKNQSALFLFDYINSYFEEFLLEEDEALFLPIDWTDHHFDACDFQIKGQILNQKAEMIANSILENANPTS